MRLALCAIGIVAASCGGGGGYDYYPPGSGPAGCEVDTDCSGDDVCARDGECLPPSELMQVSVNWTVGGAAASDASCAGQESLEISFDDGQDYGFGFSPVPCNEGKFTVDRLPTLYIEAGISDEAESYYLSGSFDGSGNVAFDLPAE